MTHASDELTPLQLSGQLNSLPCSMSFRQEESTSIIRLIEQVSQTYPLSSFLYLWPTPFCLKLMRNKAKSPCEHSC